MIQESDIKTHDCGIVDKHSLEDRLLIGIGDDEGSDDLPEDRERTDEDYRFAGHGPLRTLLVLMVGPLLAAAGNALLGVMTSFWVSRPETNLGEVGLAGISCYNAFDGIGRSCGGFVWCGASTQIASLFGEGQGVQAGQILTDMMRVSIGLAALVACLIPSYKPLARWFGTPEETVQVGFDYICPLTAGVVITCWFSIAAGCLQAEGRTFLCGLLQVACFVMNMAIWNPLFLLGLHVGLKGAAFSTLLSEAIIGLGVLGLYFCGRFGVKPALSGLLSKFSPRTLPALSVGVSQLVSNLGPSLPAVALRKFMGMAVANSPTANFDAILAGFNAAVRFRFIGDSLCLGVNAAMIPAASYARSARKPMRFLRLIGHAWWIMVVISGCTWTVTTFFPRQISRMFGTEEAFLDSAAYQVRANNCLTPLSCARFVARGLLQALHRGGRATLLSIIADFFGVAAALCGLYYTKRDAPERLIWAFGVANVFSILLSVPFVYGPLRALWREGKRSPVREVEPDDGFGTVFQDPESAPDSNEAEELHEI